MKILAFDIGNTNTHCALFDFLSIKETFIFPTDNIGDKKIYKRLAKFKADVLCYSSVVPDTKRAFEENSRNILQLRPFNITRDFGPLVENATRCPETTGQDRLCNASWAFFAKGTASCVVDVGSAVNFDVVDSKGRFLGGIIGPGLTTALSLMSLNLALIPNVRTSEQKKIIGNDTPSAVQLGAFLAVKGLIQLGIENVKKKFRENAWIIGTGRDSKYFKEYFDEIVPDATLKGLVVSFLTYERKLV